MNNNYPQNPNMQMQVPLMQQNPMTNNEPPIDAKPVNEEDEIAFYAMVSRQIQKKVEHFE